MIDKTQPPPGWDLRMVKGRWRSERLPGGTISDHRTQADCISTAWRIYAEDSRPAVVDFAESVAAWLVEDDVTDAACFAEFTATGLPEESINAWARRQILAAARGERSLP